MTTPVPPRLRFLDHTTLDNLATSIELCVAALEPSQTRVRGLDALLVLATLAELLHEAAERER